MTERSGDSLTTQGRLRFGFRAQLEPARSITAIPTDQRLPVKYWIQLRVPPADIEYRAITGLGLWIETGDRLSGKDVWCRKVLIHVARFVELVVG